MNKTIGMTLLSGVLMTSAHAAVIGWTTSAVSGNVSEVSALGTSVEAVNATSTEGVVANPTLSINGTTFTSSTALLANSYNGDSWTDAVADSGYDAFLSRVDYDGNGIGPITLTTFTGLTIGNEYLVQVWHADVGAVNKSRTMTYAGTGDNVLDGFSYGTGLFTADATTQDLIVTASQNGTRFNGYQLRDVTGVPEPATIGLVAAFGGGILFIRRRFMI